MRDPGSTWAPLPEAGDQGNYDKTQLIVHSTGTRASAANNRRYFAGGGVAVESTFIVGLDATDPTLQILDSAERADANGSANRRAISIEVVGLGTDPFTDWQISELIRIGRWAHDTHGIPLRVIPSEAGAGFGWHVMFGAPGPWTTVTGKVCPGSQRIAQLKAVVFPAIFAGHAAPPVDQEDDMDQKQFTQYLQGALTDSTVLRTLQTAPWKATFGRTGRSMHDTVGLLQANVAALVARDPDVDLDPSALAAALADAIPDELAEQVVDNLAARLTKEPS